MDRIGVLELFDQDSNGFNVCLGLSERLGNVGDFFLVTSLFVD